MKILNIKANISTFLAAATVASGTLLVSPASMADSRSSGVVSTSQSTVVVNRAITEEEVLAAQRAWGDALVAISTTYETKGIEAARALAEEVIDKAYGYQFGAVLFKPTLTLHPQTFRTTRAGALAYFVGGDPAFPVDKGFALKGWRKVEIKNTGIFISGDTATTMGNVILTDKDGKVVTVDKTWQFLKDDNGNLRIILHHSSLPYTS
ncbi:MAG: metal-independent carbonic anhydrase [Nodosilinea sp.]